MYGEHVVRGVLETLFGWVFLELIRNASQSSLPTFSQIGELMEYAVRPWIWQNYQGL
jgi:hypothetical protein